MRHRSDLNQKEIVEGLRKIGASVQVLSGVGKGCPDLLVGFRCQNYLFEIKQSLKSKLTKDEAIFAYAWNGKVYIVYDLQKAINILTEKGAVK